MAPKMKKKAQSKNNKKEPDGKDKGKGAPQIKISAQNEQKLRRLLQNNASSLPSSATSSSVQVMSESQRTKKILNIYDKLACQGFTNDQIELALSALSGHEITLETTLDWLCLNIPGNELPTKFSSGVSFLEEKGSEKPVNVISAASENWLPSKTNTEESVSENAMMLPPRPYEHSIEDPQDVLKNEGADWIRRYMSQQSEEESDDGASEEDNDDSDWEMWTDPDERTRRKKHRSAVDPGTRAITIVEEFKAARQAASEAKIKGDKGKQALAGRLIRDLKQEMLLLGLSEDIESKCVQTSSPHESECFQLTNQSVSGLESIVTDNRDNMGDTLSEKGFLNQEKISTDICEVGISKLSIEQLHSDHKIEPETSKLPTKENEEPEEEELFGLFEEISSGNEALPESIIEMQRKEKALAQAQEKAKRKKQEKWNKVGKPSSQEELIKQPKAILQQQCQKYGWEAPKYEKVAGNRNSYSYSLTIVRPTTGRGKSKKVGGVTKFEFPDTEHVFETVDDAQNSVATVALFRLFSDLPLCQVLPEPYRSMCIDWSTGEEASKPVKGEDIRREDFVKSLKTLNEPLKEVDNNERADQDAFLDGELIPEDILERSVGEGSKIDKETESQHLKLNYEQKARMEKYKIMMEKRNALPMAECREQLLSLLKENDVIVVSGQTGCGKTTQVPQYILDEMIKCGQGGFCNVICTQPRRIAAISVAERVAEERCEPPPGTHGSLVGYQVRLDSAWNPKTRLLFCTTGILLRKLMGDPYLKDVTHIIVDEVHERTVLGDFLLIILRDLLEKRSSFKLPKLKLILMSATVDASLFSHYYANCPVISAKGRTHPVTSYFLEDIYESLGYLLSSDSQAAISSTKTSKKMLSKNAVDNSRGRKNLIKSGWGDETILEDKAVNEHYNENLYESYSEQTRRNLKLINEEVIDYDLLEDLIRFIDHEFEPGAILVFLPGMSEILNLVERLTVSHQFRAESSEWILPLFSSMAPGEQRKAFARPPENIRKIVVATNIAETSITIDDVVYVIDCGKHKENRYIPEKKMSSMVEAWISQANAQQRSGRAGRVKPGICFYVYTKYRYEHLLRPFQVPEMLRVSLVELCLQIKTMCLGDIFAFLQKAIEPPKSEALTSAVATLFEVGALEGENEDLTPLGYHLAKLPVDVRIGKMMLYGAIFGCLAPVLTIAACLSHKSPFLSPKDEKSNAERAKLLLSLERKDDKGYKKFADEQNSDHILLVVAYNRWRKIMNESGDKGTREYCKTFSLSNTTLHMIRDMRIQFANLLAEIGFIELPKAGNKRKDMIDKYLDDTLQPFNIYSQEPSLIKSILCAGLYPNVAVMEEDSIKLGHADGLTRRSGLAPNNRPRWFDDRQEVFINPSSINHSVSQFPHPFLVFLEKVQTSKVFLRDTTVISPFPVLLFGGPINIQHQAGSVTVDGWIKMNAPAQTAVLFRELRLSLHNILQELIQKPKERATVTKKEVVHSIIKLFIEEEKQIE